MCNKRHQHEVHHSPAEPFTYRDGSRAGATGSYACGPHSGALVNLDGKTGAGR